MDTDRRRTETWTGHEQGHGKEHGQENGNWTGTRTGTLIGTCPALVAQNQHWWRMNQHWWHSEKRGYSLGRAIGS
jgi:hypothetical protein